MGYVSVAPGKSLVKPNKIVNKQPVSICQAIRTKKLCIPTQLCSPKKQHILFLQLVYKCPFYQVHFSDYLTSMFEVENPYIRVDKNSESNDKVFF